MGMRTIWKLLEMTAALGLLFLAAGWCGQARENAGRVSVFLDESGLEREQGERICELEAERENAVEVGFWGEQADMTVSCQETGNTSRVTLIACSGNPELVIPGGNLLSWQPEGCLVDEKTAQDLFGTLSVGGQILWCNGQSYQVLGTFESAKRAMARLAEAGDGPVLDCVVLDPAQSSSPGTEGEQFLLRHGLNGEVIDFTLLCAVVEDLLLLLPVVLTVTLGASLLAGWGEKRTLFSRFLGLLGTGAAFALLLWMLKSRLRIPADMLPSRWSDFDFWPEWWQGQRQNLLRIFATPLGADQLTMLWNLVRSAVCSLAGTGLGAAALSPRIAFRRVENIMES